MDKDSTLSVGVRLLSTVFLLVFFLKQKSSVVGCSWLEGTGFDANFILHEAVLKRCTSMSSDLLAFSALPKPYQSKGAYFRLASDYTGTERRTHPRRIPKHSYRERSPRSSGHSNKRPRRLIAPWPDEPGAEYARRHATSVQYQTDRPRSDTGFAEPTMA